MNSIKRHLRPLSSFEKFQWLGYIIGGLLPVYLCIVLELAGVNENIIEGDALVFFLIFISFGFVLGFLALYFNAKYSPDHELFKWVYNFQAGYSILLIHLLIVYSKGPMSSVFSGTYLYLFAIVGYSFGKSSNLYGAALAGGLSYIINLLVLPWEKRVIDDTHLIAWKHSIVNTNNTSGDGNFIMYMIVFLIEVIVTVQIAPKKISNISNEETGENK